MATVLLIDDDADLVEANKLVLVQRGYQVQAAYSAKEARAAIKQARPDAIVLDVMMESDLAGIELAQEIGAEFADLPTIILSSLHTTKGKSFHFTPDEEWLPVVRFLDKPVDPAALADEIDALLKK